MSFKLKNILCVGCSTLDSVYIVPFYPLPEDYCEWYPHTFILRFRMSSDHRWARGGNASNNCTALSHLGAKCEFLGTLSSRSTARFIIDDFKAHNICIDNCVYYEEYDAPTSSVIINAQNGSRTIVHSNKGMPEITFEDFKKLDLSCYGWIHFEGRNTETVASIIEYIDVWNKKQSSESDKICISVELEKPRPETINIVPLADFVFIGKEYAAYIGCKDMYETLEAMRKFTKKSATIIVPWGELGAVATGPDGIIVVSQAFPPAKVIDTLAAGDTFAAATIFALTLGRTLKESITFGCQVAGAKVGLFGFDGFDEICQKFLKHLYNE